MVKNKSTSKSDKKSTKGKTNKKIKMISVKNISPVEKWVYITGNRWVILWKTEKEYPKLKGCAGLTDFSTRTIRININAIKRVTKEDKAVYEKEIVRHELIHAFLYECGLENSSWADNEEIIDWMAIQFNKMVCMFKEAEAL